MIINLKKFGTILSSRPAGREAWLVACAYILPKSEAASEIIEVDFSGVEVLSPSWADEFITPLKAQFGSRIKLLPSTNPTVKATLETILK